MSIWDNFQLTSVNNRKKAILPHGKLHGWAPMSSIMIIWKVQWNFPTLARLLLPEVEEECLDENPSNNRIVYELQSNVKSVVLPTRPIELNFHTVCHHSSDAFFCWKSCCRVALATLIECSILNMESTERRNLKLICFRWNNLQLAA